MPILPGKKEPKEKKEKPAKKEKPVKEKKPKKEKRPKKGKAAKDDEDAEDQEPESEPELDEDGNPIEVKKRKFSFGALFGKLKFGKKKKGGDEDEDEDEDGEGGAAAKAEAPKGDGDGEGDEDGEEGEEGEAKGGIAGLLAGLMKNKIILIAAAVVLVAIIGGGVFYFVVLRGSGDTAGEEGDPDEVITKEPYVVEFEQGDLKLVRDSEDEDAEPIYEITIQSAKALTSAEKSSYGLVKSDGRLAAIELDFRLLDLSQNWNLYNRRVADANGHWLDELLVVSDLETLDIGEHTTETLVIELFDEQAPSPETVVVYFYTQSWNRKETADASCEVTIEPAPRRTGPAARTVETQYGVWEGNDYTSRELGMRIGLPEDWSNRAAVVQPADGNSTIEASASRSDGRAGMQIKVVSEPGFDTADAHLNSIRTVLERAVGDTGMSEIQSQTVAGNVYRYFNYTLNGVFYQIYAIREGDTLTEIAIHFPENEETQARSFISNLRSMN